MDILVTKAKECLGRCPKCNSEQIEYSVGELHDGDNYKYNGVCQDCGCEFVEWYKVVYDATTWDEIRQDPD